MSNKKQNAATEPMPVWWPQHLLDEAPAAELLGVSVMSLRDWRCRKTRALPFIKLGSRVKYSPDDLWRYVCTNTVRPVVCA